MSCSQLISVPMTLPTWDQPFFTCTIILLYCQLFDTQLRKQVKIEGIQKASQYTQSDKNMSLFHTTIAFAAVLNSWEYAGTNVFLCLYSFSKCDQL